MKEMNVGLYVISTLVRLILPTIYFTYLRKLEKLKCVCATSHALFVRLKVLLVVQVALSLLPWVAQTLLGKRLAKFVRFAVGAALVVTFLIWFRDMKKLECKCSDAWQKTLWFWVSVFTAVDIALILLALLFLPLWAHKRL